MKLLQDSEDAKAERKSLKPQVERRRRERMNRSLESLKTLLIERQEASQRRVEKAEILEHAVLFLQNSRRPGEADGGGGQKHLQDGFSTCLQTAAQFLGPKGKGLLLGAALDAASLAARFSRASDSDSAGAQRRRTEARSSSGCLLLGKSSRSILQLLIQRSGHKLMCTPALATVPSCVLQTRGESQSSGTSTPLQPSRAGKQSAAPSQAAGQSMWRPWPCSGGRGPDAQPELLNDSIMPIHNPQKKIMCSSDFLQGRVQCNVLNSDLSMPFL
ncbi:uncharacterized protein LOC130212922 isoform X2 [Pseudoliparis swirei]|uniref:uncharacterized protein LOC130212922 isoform X2 n=1 Tax=Pseudoliparis swirei TaxID=2059687 RepID=UPI0024BEAB84|nr:uncharacterized protein LOC130212922 isoform X2 [Pseudoliparis swirei]